MKLLGWILWTCLRRDRRFVVSGVDADFVSDGLADAAGLSVGFSVDC